jgi:NAD(P)-dependent dehydrogenase (short-subunit alcohol dehydrogenase family)
VSISGKHVLVTGGSRGIGLAIATLLAEQGARVSIVSRSATQTTLFGAQADITDEEQVRAAFAACREVNGPIAILINNAGIAESAPVSRTDLAMWNRIIATNLTGPFLCTRTALPDMIDRRWGRIVSIASTAGLEGAPYISAYCASKHGVVGFTRALAAELAKSNVTVNAVCPGYTETEMMLAAIANITARTGRSEGAARELMAQGNPQGRIATAGEVAQAVLVLIEGSRSGAVVVVPGAES